MLILNPISVEGVLIFIISAFGMDCIPFIAASGIKNQSKYKCAYPYSSYANGTLFLGEADLQYVFWQVGPTEPTAYSSSHAVYHDEYKFVYQIRRDWIYELTIDENGVCRIIGAGEIILPKDITMGASEIKVEADKPERIFRLLQLLLKKNAEQVILDWKNNYL